MQFAPSFHYCPFLQNVVYVVSLNPRSGRFFLLQNIQAVNLVPFLPVFIFIQSLWSVLHSFASYLYSVVHRNCSRWYYPLSLEMLLSYTLTGCSEFDKIFVSPCLPYNMYMNQQDAQSSCDQTLCSIRCSTCFGLYQSIFRNNFISCTSYLVYAGTIRLAVVWLQPHISYSKYKLQSS